jgi:hypothetical protein
VALPSVFIIDKEGIIQYSSVNNMYCGRSTAEILRVLNALQYVQKIQDKHVLLIGKLVMKQFQSIQKNLKLKKIKKCQN